MGYLELWQGHSGRSAEWRKYPTDGLGSKTGQAGLWLREGIVMSLGNMLLSAPLAWHERLKFLAAGILQ